jgi:hypothetical protein
LAGRFEYIGFCSVVKLPVAKVCGLSATSGAELASSRNAIVLQAAVVVISPSGIVGDQPVLMPLPFRHDSLNPRRTHKF